MKFERSSSPEYYHIPHIGKTKDTCERGLFLYKESEILDFPCPSPVSNIKIFPIPSSFSSLKEKQNQVKFAQEPQVTHNSRDSLIPRVT